MLKRLSSSSLTVIVVIQFLAGWGWMMRMLKWRKVWGQCQGRWADCPPADTCMVCNTSRMKKHGWQHSRIYFIVWRTCGEMFGIEPNRYAQLGYDFSSLEGRNGRIVWSMTLQRNIATTLSWKNRTTSIQSLPKKISEIIGKVFGRTPTKSVKNIAALKMGEAAKG